MFTQLPFIAYFIEIIAYKKIVLELFFNTRIRVCVLASEMSENVDNINFGVL